MTVCTLCIIHFQSYLFFHQNHNFLSTMLFNVLSYSHLLHNKTFIFVCRQHQLLGKNVWKLCMRFCIATVWSSQCFNFNQYTTIYSIRFVLLRINGDESIHCKFTAGIWMRVHEGTGHYVCNRN